MTSKQECSTFVPQEQKFNFRGTWNPYGCEPVLNRKYDAYIVNNNSGEYEVGDWILRDGENESFTHISVGIFSAVKGYVDSNYISNEQFNYNIGELKLGLSREIYKLKKEIDELRKEKEDEQLYLLESEELQLLCFE